MTTLTRDLVPYTADWFQRNSGSASDSDALTTDDGATSEFVLTSSTGSITLGPLGVGSDPINYPTDIPDGYTLTEAKYVVVAYTEAGGDITVDASGWGYTPVPETWPFITLQSSFRSGNFVIDHLPVGGYDGETTARFSDLTGISGGQPLDVIQIDTQDTFSPVHITYFALRLTYTSDEVDLPCNTDVALDLSTAEQVLDDFYSGDDGPYGQYSDGVIWAIPTSTAPWVASAPEFFFPGLVTEAKPYQVTITYDPDSTHDLGGRLYALGSLPAGGEQDAMAAGTWEFDLYYATETFDGPDSLTFTIHPEAGKNILFETSYEGAVSAITIRKLCSTVPPPLRLTNRDDRFASAPRLTGSSSRQGSNRMTGYL